MAQGKCAYLIMAKALVLIGSMLDVPAVHAQWAPTNAPPTAKKYCPSNTGGQCFYSRKAAEVAMRAAEPEIGQYLKEKIPELNGDYARIPYEVPDQPPSSYSPPLYGINTTNFVQAQPFCPNSNWNDLPRVQNGHNYCTSEDELVQGYIAAGFPYSGGVSCINRRNIHLVGQPILPYRKSESGVLWQSQQGHPLQRALEWTQDCLDHNNNYFPMTLKYEIFRVQRFYCPPGLRPIDTADPAVSPNLCRSSRTAWISVRHAQYIGCPIGHPCNPENGDKLRAETDFTFAGRDFTRYYHSLRQLGMKNARMGPGWTHTYSTFISPSGMYVVSGEGVLLPYRHRSGNQYAVIGAAGASVGLLVKLADGTSKMIDKDGQTSIFSSRGDLVSISNPRRPEMDVTLVYSTYIHDGQPLLRLSKVIDVSGRELSFIYDANRFLVGIQLPGGQYISYGYGEHQNLIFADYGDGQVKKYIYGESVLASDGDQGLLTGIIHEDGARYGSFFYDVYGRVIKSVLHGEGGPTESTEIDYPSASQSVVRTMNGEVRTYTYNASRQILSVVSNGETESSVYDTTGKGWLKSQTDRNGVKTDYGYNDMFQQTQRIEASNDSMGRKRTIQTDWHATLNVPTERRTLNSENVLVAKTTWTYNARGQILTVTQIDPASGGARTTTSTYCEQTDVTAGMCPVAGLVTSTDGPRTDEADLTTYTYYPEDDGSCHSSPTICPHRKGDLWKLTNALGQVTEILAYDAAGRPLSVKDTNGIVTELTYQPRGWLTSRTVKGATLAEDRSILIDYWANGLVKRMTEEDGSYTDYSYDAAHRLTRIKDSSGNAIQYTLDNAGNRTGEATRDPNGGLARSVSRVYDLLGRLQSQVDAYSHATDYIYDGNGNVTTEIDAQGRVTKNTYDPLNRLAQAIQDMGGGAATTKFQYDAQNQLTRVTDPKGLHTDYTYNGLGDLTQLSSPDTGVTGYTYDSGGNRKTHTDARGVTAVYEYDGLNRLTGIAYPNASLNVGYQYDTVNSICASDESYAQGRLTRITDASGMTQYCYNRFGELTRKMQMTGSQVFEVRYHYDAAGRLAGQTYPDGTVLDAVLDGEGRVVELGIVPSGGGRQVVLTGVTYAPFGPSTGWTYGNGRNVMRSLNQNYQPQAIHDADTGGLSLWFEFDAMGNLARLKDAAQSSTLAQYSYDALNRLEHVKDGPTGTPIETFDYDATGNRTSVLRAGVITAYAYPASSHRLSSVGGMARSYDAAGNTTGLSSGTGYAYNDAGRLALATHGSVVEVSYGYNGKGEQVRRTQGTDTTYYVYDEAGRMLGEYGNAGGMQQQVMWFGNMPVGVLHRSGAGHALHYIEPDHLGTPRVIIDGIRNVPIWTWSIAGEAFGSTPPDEDPDNDGVAFAFDLRYPGQRYDNTTGLNYNYFRDYDPSTGRYVQSDPIGLMGGINTYGYVVGNPLLNSDPRGLVTWRGYAHGAGFGHAVIAAARYNFHLVSDCVNGRQAIVDIDASFFGGTLGVPITCTISQVSLDDGKSEIDPYALTGSASMKGAGLAAGGGVAYSGFQLGAGKSPGAWGGQGGWDATLYWYPIGNSKMDGSPKWVSCGACGSK